MFLLHIDSAIEYQVEFLRWPGLPLSNLGLGLGRPAIIHCSSYQVVTRIASSGHHQVQTRILHTTSQTYVITSPLHNIYSVVVVVVMVVRLCLPKIILKTAQCKFIALKC